MKEDSNKNIIIVLLLVIIVILSGLVCFFAFKNNNHFIDNCAPATVNDDIDKVQSVENNAFSTNWLEYLVSLNISDIKLVKYDENGEKSVNIKKNEISNLLSNMKNAKIIKHYYNSGLGSIISGYYLEANYVSNNNKYQFKLECGVGSNDCMVFDASLDDNFKKILDYNKSEEKFNVMSNENIKRFYQINNYSSFMFNNYFN